MVIAKQETKVTELERRNGELETRRKKSAVELQSSEEKSSKQESAMKQAESARSLAMRSSRR